MHEKAFDPWILSSLQLMGFGEVFLLTLRLVLYLVSLNREKLKDRCPFNDILFSKVIRKDVEEATADSSIKKNVITSLKAVKVV